LTCPWELLITSGAVAGAFAFDFDFDFEDFDDDFDDEEDELPPPPPPPSPPPPSSFGYIFSLFSGAIFWLFMKSRAEVHSRQKELY
jgi:hypothetical protein